MGRGGDQIVPVGTHFIVMYKLKKREYPHGLEKPAEIECTKKVDLKVENVTSYGKSMEFLPGNSTGCLVFTEQDVDLLPAGWVLSTCSNTGI